jgi:tRNA (guanine37-N1)-methyltransferase
MRIDIITLFPDFFDSPLSLSILGRAVKNKVVTIQTHNLRDYASDRYGTVDDTPYGGGPGMVLKVDVLKNALDSVVSLDSEKPFVILLTPQGIPFSQSMAQDLSEHARIILICGHYEGFDERIRTYVDQELSIGPYVLSGGEPAALIVIDSLVRLQPGALGDAASPHEESFSLTSNSGQPLLEYPHYTRPEEFDHQHVPEILLSGNHAAIAEWRKEKAKERTDKRYHI